MYFELEVDDAASPFLQKFIEEKPRWLSSALKSAGYWAQKEIKTGILSGAPGGQPYARMMPVWMRRKLEKALGHQVRRSYTPMGKLVKAVGYDKTYASTGLVTVGWLSSNAVNYGEKQEKGFFTKVNDRMRGAFIIAGIYFPQSKTTIAVPARPTYGPMKPVIQRGATKRVEEKIQSYLKGNMERSRPTTRAKYMVHECEY